MLTRNSHVVVTAAGPSLAGCKFPPKKIFVQPLVSSQLNFLLLCRSRSNQADLADRQHFFYWMTYSSCLQKLAAENCSATRNISFALSEIPPSAYVCCQSRQPSARIKAKRDRGEEIDYVDLMNGEIKRRARSTAEPRIKKSKLSADPCDRNAPRFQETGDSLDCEVKPCIALLPSILLLDDHRRMTVISRNPTPKF